MEGDRKEPMPKIFATNCTKRHIGGFTERRNIASYSSRRKIIIERFWLKIEKGMNNKPGTAQVGAISKAQK